jgi:hypothetical protein
MRKCQHQCKQHHQACHRRQAAIALRGEDDRGPRRQLAGNSAAKPAGISGRGAVSRARTILTSRGAESDGGSFCLLPCRSPFNFLLSLDAFAKLLAAAMQVRSHGADGQFQRLRNLLVTALLLMVEHQYGLSPPG